MLLRYLWPSPLSLLGMLIATACRAPLRRRDHTLEACGGWLPQFLPRIGLGMRPAAMTLGHVILGVDQPTLDRWRAHERVHVGQAERWGPLFPLAYAAASAVAWAQGRDPYAGNRFEIEAFSVRGGATHASPLARAGKIPTQRADPIAIPNM